MKEVHTIITPNNHESAKNSPRERAFSSQEEMERFITEQLDRCASLGDVRELFYDRLLTQREKLRAVSHHTKRHFLERVAQLINVRDEGAADFWNELGDEVYSSWLTDCRKEVAHALNFLDGASLEKTVNYVQMIRKFYVHGYDYTQDYTEKFSSIATKIKEQTDDAQAIFFASVIGKEALRAITEKIVPSYLAEPTEQDAEDNKEEDLLREEMGDEAFERYADNLFYEGSRMIDHDPDRTDVPFVIARNRFGYHAANGLFLSAERDYERLKKDYAHFNTWADREFYHPGGHDAESGMSWYDADEHAYEGVESNYGSVLNDHAYHEAEAYLSSMIRRISIPIASMEKISDHPEDVQSYILFTSLRMQHFLQEQGFALQDLSVQEQFFFLRYAKIVRNHEAEQLKSFVRRFGNRGLKSFLSLQHSGHDMGTKILHIGEKYDHTTADAIFAKYAELVDYAQNAAQYLAQHFSVTDPTIIHNLTEHMLLRGKALLSMCADSDNLTQKDIITKLETLHAETELFKNAFHDVKTLQPDFSLENATAVQFKILSGTELLTDKSTIQRMEDIYLANYEHFPQEFKDTIIASLHQNLANPHTRFYTLFHKGRIVAFNSFTPQEDGTIHFANFNVDPAYQSAKLGEAMMEATLDQEASNAPIIAEAVADSAIAHTYLTKKNFTKTGQKSTIAGIPIWHIKREKTLPQAA